MTSKRAQATDITPKVKKAVWERDAGACILCGNPEAMPNAHYVPRSDGGLGIEENVVTLCNRCHYELDQTTKRKALLDKIAGYLRGLYDGWDGMKLRYSKWGMGA